MVSDILQPTHLLLILVVALLVLGPKRLPEVGRQLGNGLRDFRAAINGERIERHQEPPAPSAPATTAAVSDPIAAAPPGFDSVEVPPPPEAFVAEPVSPYPESVSPYLAPAEPTAADDEPAGERELLADPAAPTESVGAHTEPHV